MSEPEGVVDAARQYLRVSVLGDLERRCKLQPRPTTTRPGGRQRALRRMLIARGRRYLVGNCRQQGDRVRDDRSAVEVRCVVTSIGSYSVRGRGQRRCGRFSHR